MYFPILKKMKLKCPLEICVNGTNGNSIWDKFEEEIRMVNYCDSYDLE
jgi:hypothetical protein